MKMKMELDVIAVGREKKWNSARLRAVLVSI
jgi:hypothetical protein